MGGKRYADTPREFGESKINLKKVFFVVLIFILIIVAIITSVYFIKNRKKSEVNEVVSNVENESKFPKKYEGYDVLGKINIEKINVNTYILDSTESDAMDKAPVKLYGGKINEEGNFCIAGHNYEEIFARLSELQVGDEFSIENTDEELENYKITEILDVDPTDLTVLMNVIGKTQVTLITCKEGATERLIIKAEKVEKELEENNEENTSTNNENDVSEDNTITNEV